MRGEAPDAMDRCDRGRAGCLLALQTAKTGLRSRIALFKPRRLIASKTDIHPNQLRLPIDHRYGNRGPPRRTWHCPFYDTRTRLCAAGCPPRSAMSQRTGSGSPPSRGSYPGGAGTRSSLAFRTSALPALQVRRREVELHRPPTHRMSAHPSGDPRARPAAGRGDSEVGASAVQARSARQRDDRAPGRVDPLGPRRLRRRLDSDGGIGRDQATP